MSCFFALITFKCTITIIETISRFSIECSNYQSYCGCFDLNIELFSHSHFPLISSPYLPKCLSFRVGRAGIISEYSNHSFVHCDQRAICNSMDDTHNSWDKINWRMHYISLCASVCVCMWVLSVNGMALFSICHLYTLHDVLSILMICHNVGVSGF